MLTVFHLAEGVGLAEFEAAWDAFVARLRAEGLADGAGPVARRLPDSPLDTDTARDHALCVALHFRDAAQAEAAYAAIVRRDEPGTALHHAVWGCVRDPVFTLWQEP